MNKIQTRDDKLAPMTPFLVHCGYFAHAVFSHYNHCLGVTQQSSVCATIVSIFRKLRVLRGSIRKLETQKSYAEIKNFGLQQSEFQFLSRILKKFQEEGIDKTKAC